MRNETNLFVLSMEPEINKMFECFIYQNQIINIPSNSFAYKSRNTMISTIHINGSKEIQVKNQYIEWIIKKALFEKLNKIPELFDFDYRWSELSSNKSIVKGKEYSFLVRYRIQIMSIDKKLVMAIEPKLKIYNRLSMQVLIEKNPIFKNLIKNKHKALVFVEKENIRKWMYGIVHEFDEQSAKVEVPGLYMGIIKVGLSRVIPHLKTEVLEQICNKNIMNELISVKNNFYSKEREYINQFVANYLQNIFPLDIGASKIVLKKNELLMNELDLIRINENINVKFIVERDNLKVEGSKRLLTLSNISIKENFKLIPTVLFAYSNKMSMLEGIIKMLNEGITSGNFYFSLPSKFGITLEIKDKFIMKNENDYYNKINQFIYSTEEKHQYAFPIFYLHEQSPNYYPIKAKLASYGKVSQIISKDIKDIYSLWNLGTNLFAKVGGIPWSIKPNGNEEADLFLGFSFSSIKTDRGLSRNLGYVNVFDRNGVWKLMRSSTDYLDFDKRLIIIPEIIKNAIDGYLASGEKVKIIDLHYSKKFSRIEREKCYRVILDKIPDIKEVNFISINKNHPIRFYNALSQKLIVRLGYNRILVNTSSDINKNRLLEFSFWSLPDSEINEEKLISLYKRILNLTLLNWRSVKDTTEPVTLRYSEEIARLLNHFNLTEWKEINNQLSRIPWFI